MDALAPFRIPLAALKVDEAAYHWDLGPDFLALFDPDHHLADGLFSVDMTLSRTGGVTTFDFYVEGKVDTICDRCMAPITMPILADYQVVVKFGNPAESTDEVVFIDPEAPDLNVGQYLYEFVILSVPISQRIPDCEKLDLSPCDVSVLNYLSQQALISPPEPSEPSSLWDELKKRLDN